MSRRGDPTGGDNTVEASSPAELASTDLCVAISTGGPFQTFELPEFGEARIGRSSSCHIRIDDPSVSRQHAVLRTVGGVHLKDIGSANGVRINGRRIDVGEWVRLSLGEVAQIGSALLVVRTKHETVRPRRIWSHGYFEGRLEEECARSARSGAQFGVLRVTVPAGLDPAQVEDVFASWLRAADVLSRYAPSEYEVLYVDQRREQVEAATARLLELLADRLRCARDQFRSGVACFPSDGASADELLTHANDAVRGVVRPADTSQVVGGVDEDQLARIAASDVTVLILGETGVGKEVCAERIHVMSGRGAHKLLRLNCTALSETLLESELFGHEKGSFTGAVRAKPGLFETAQGGTVFLDEIGELPPTIQVKLLRVLEERKVQRIGALEPRPIDVRFIAATNRDLETEVLTGRFRQDLLFRINTFVIRLPPLRQRVAEIEPLARHFLSRYADHARLPAPALSDAALQMLLRYPWPGNVRELRNVMERAVVLAGEGAIDPRHLPVDKMSATLVPAPAAVVRAAAPVDDSAPEELEGPPTLSVELPAVESLRSELDELERRRILQALETAAGNQSQAARKLGISRATLIRRLDLYGIPRPRKP